MKQNGQFFNNVISAIFCSMLTISLLSCRIEDISLESLESFDIRIVLSGPLSNDSLAHLPTDIRKLCYPIEHLNKKIAIPIATLYRVGVNFQQNLETTVKKPLAGSLKPRVLKRQIDLNLKTKRIGRAFTIPNDKTWDMSSLTLSYAYDGQYPSFIIIFNHENDSTQYYGEMPVYHSVEEVVAKITELVFVRGVKRITLLYDYSPSRSIKNKSITAKSKFSEFQISTQSNVAYRRLTEEEKSMIKHFMSGFVSLLNDQVEGRNPESGVGTRDRLIDCFEGINNTVEVSLAGSDAITPMTALEYIDRVATLKSRVGYSSAVFGIDTSSIEISGDSVMIAGDVLIGTGLLTYLQSFDGQYDDYRKPYVEETKKYGTFEARPKEERVKLRGLRVIVGTTHSYNHFKTK